jgi:hypothetical protein
MTIARVPFPSPRSSASSVSIVSRPQRSSAGRIATSSSRMRICAGVSLAPVTTMPSYPARFSSPPKCPPTLERVNQG